MGYDVIIVGGGLSGLTAASLLAKRHLKVNLECLELEMRNKGHKERSCYFESDLHFIM